MSRPTLCMGQNMSKWSTPKNGWVVLWSSHGNRRYTMHQAYLIDTSMVVNWSWFGHRLLMVIVLWIELTATISFSSQVLFSEETRQSLVFAQVLSLANILFRAVNISQLYVCIFLLDMMLDGCETGRYFKSPADLSPNLFRFIRDSVTMWDPPSYKLVYKHH